jgi:transcriptional regulator with XRE-family HTH domain
MELDKIVLPYLTAACQRRTNLYRPIERKRVQAVGITKECGMSFSTKLRELRIRDGRSLQQVADAVETSKTHVWDMEQGNSVNPGRELLVKLAGYFRISVSELVGEDPNAAGEPSDLVAMYRDLKSLSPMDRKTIETIMRGFKDAKKDS